MEDTGQKMALPGPYCFIQENSPETGSREGAKRFIVFPALSFN